MYEITIPHSSGYAADIGASVSVPWIQGVQITSRSSPTEDDALPQYVCTVSAEISREEWDKAGQSTTASPADIELKLPLDVASAQFSFVVIFTDKTEKTISGTLKLGVKSHGAKDTRVYCT